MSDAIFRLFLEGPDLWVSSCVDGKEILALRVRRHDAIIRDEYTC
jgi:hypothetical protein